MASLHSQESGNFFFFFKEIKENRFQNLRKRGKYDRIAPKILKEVEKLSGDKFSPNNQKTGPEEENRRHLKASWSPGVEVGTGDSKTCIHAFSYPLAGLPYPGPGRPHAESTFKGLQP